MATTDPLAAEFGELAAGLRQAGETGLIREITDAIHRAAGPIPGEIRAGLVPKLPNRYAGVLKEDVQFGVAVRASRADPGVSVYGRNRTKRRRLRRLDVGILEHPLFGDRDRWYRQDVTPRFFSQPVHDATPRVRAEMEAAISRINDQIWARVHRV
jgi:hypothetical protein